jgi:hypothetical protein
MTKLDRRIRTRCLEALLLETRKCYDRDIDVATPAGPQSLRDMYRPDKKEMRIFGHPLEPGKSIVPRQINIYPAPMTFTDGVGGISDLECAFEVDFIFPGEVIFYEPGALHNTYLDELDLLRIWLFNGGSVPNKNARLQDPDNPGSVINLEINRFSESHWADAPGNAGIVVPVIVGFGSREDTRTGARA